MMIREYLVFKVHSRCFLIFFVERLKLCMGNGFKALLLFTGNFLIPWMTFLEVRRSSLL